RSHRDPHSFPTRRSSDLLVGTSPNVLIVQPDLSVENVEEFIALAKANPGGMNYGSVGPGSSSHLGMAMLEHEAGIALEQIPYTGDRKSTRLNSSHVSISY